MRTTSEVGEIFPELVFIVRYDHSEMHSSEGKHAHFEMQSMERKHLLHFKWPQKLWQSICMCQF